MSGEFRPAAGCVNLGDKQADAQLNGGDVFDEALFGEDLQEFDVRFECGPRGEWNKGGMQDGGRDCGMFDDIQKI